MRKRWRFVALVVLVPAALGAAYWVADPLGTQAGPKAPPERPFVELEAAVAPYTASGWELATRPRLPGPYRKAREGGASIGPGPGSSMVCRVRDDSGTVTEELRVEGDGTFGQLIVWLDTASGDQTLVAMRRPHKP